MEVLDEIHRKQNSLKTFSYLSFFAGCILIVLFIIMISLFPATYTAREGLPTPSIYLINAIRISSIAGFIFTLLSFINKEPSGIIKWSGALINVLCFIGIYGSILFVVFLKMMQ